MGDKEILAAIKRSAFAPGRLSSNVDHSWCRASVMPILGAGGKQFVANRIEPLGGLQKYRKEREGSVQDSGRYYLGPVGSRAIGSRRVERSEYARRALVAPRVRWEGKSWMKRGL